MAQIANRDDARNSADNAKDNVKGAVDKATESAKNATERTAETGRQATDRTVEISRQTAERTAEAGRQATERGTATAQRLFAGASRAAGATAKIESDFAKKWVELAGEQVRHQTETVQRLMQCRDWREMAEIQGSFVRESLSRMAHAVNYQLELGNAVTTKMLSIGREQVRDAA